MAKTKKVTRLDYLVNGGKLKEANTYRRGRILRAVEESIDQVSENALLAKEKAAKIINSIRDVADNKPLIVDKINEYIVEMDKAYGYERSKEYLTKLSEMLDETVEIEEEN